MTNLEKILNTLSPGQSLTISPVGSSMCPTFFGGRDQVCISQPQKPLKRGDIAVFRRTDGSFVIHRIHHVTADQNFFFVGDNQTEIEGPVPRSRVHAVVSAIIRKGKTIDCRKNIGYRLLARLWLLLRPARPVIMRVINMLRKVSVCRIYILF